jgi:hypothetical protein
LLGAKAAPLALKEELVRLSSAPPFWFTAAFAADGQRLVVTDKDKGELDAYSLAGDLVQRLDRPGLGPLEFNQPFRLVRRAAGFLLLDGNEHLVELDNKMVPREGWILPHPEDVGQGLPFRTERGEVAEVFLWEADGLNDSFVARGDVRDPKGWRSGVVRLTRKSPFVASFLDERPISGDTRYLYYLNLKPTLATVGEAVYEVRFATRPEIWQLSPQRRSWPVPKPLDLELPVLPRLGGWTGQPRLFARLRTAPMPAGLYAWRDRLYLLSWEPVDGGNLRWGLWRLDFASGWRGPLRLELPAGAVSAVIAPGERSWAFLVSGPVSAPEKQPFLGVKLVPADRILRELG